MGAAPITIISNDGVMRPLSRLRNCVQDSLPEPPCAQLCGYRAHTASLKKPERRAARLIALCKTEGKLPMLQTHEPGATAQEEVEHLRAQLYQAQRLCSLGVLASSVAHEFNNILTTIINYAKLGKADSDPATREKAFDKIQKASQRASQITGGMLGFARSKPTERKQTDIAELVKEVLILVEKDLAKHRVNLELHVEGNPAAVVAAAEIQQIILNLIINARQALPRGGNIRVGVTDDVASGTIEITVADTGMGIPPEKLRHIFDPFYTTKDGPDQTGSGGTGIGLSVCRRIIESHNGRIRVESIVGRGTTFTVKLPSAISLDVVDA